MSPAFWVSNEFKTAIDLPLTCRLYGARPPRTDIDAQGTAGIFPQRLEYGALHLSQCLVFDDNGAAAQSAGVERDGVTVDVNRYGLAEALARQQAIARSITEEFSCALADEDALRDAGGLQARIVILQPCQPIVLRRKTAPRRFKWVV